MQIDVARSQGFSLDAFILIPPSATNMVHFIIKTAFFT